MQILTTANAVPTTISRLVNIEVAIIADKLSPLLFDYRQC